jgi:hypothetical protein
MSEDRRAGQWRGSRLERWGSPDRGSIDEDVEGKLDSVVATHEAAALARSSQA